MRLLLAGLALALSACAAPDEERYMTKEQDAQFRDKCAATGCAIVPLPVMREILKRLREQGT